MNSTKIIADLLKDLFEFFRVKYGNSIPYESSTLSLVYDVIKLSDSKNPDIELPSLAISREEYPEILLVGTTPEPGHNKDFRGKILEINCIFKDSNYLWMLPQGSLGGMAHILCFREGDQIRNQIMLEVLQKANELLYSGKYNIDNRVTQKESV